MATFSYWILIILPLITICLSFHVQAAHEAARNSTTRVTPAHFLTSECTPSGRFRAPSSLGRSCENCCTPNAVYYQYYCSPPVFPRTYTAAMLTVNGFQEGGSGGAPSECDDRFHSDGELVVALSSGWFANRGRCGRYISISQNGRQVAARVVDECDSIRGCDADHAYEPPCDPYIVDASPAVWRALGIPERSDLYGWMEVGWYDLCWLVASHPQSVVDAEQSHKRGSSNHHHAPVEFYGVYLDMNSIIHELFLFRPATFGELCDSIFDHVDKIFRIVKPRKLVYIAIDGISPDAKRNQQSAGHNRRTGESSRTMGRETKLPGELQRFSLIKPHTTFMESLQSALREFIQLRLKTHPDWSKIKVVLSDANQAGEGEHKIMHYLRYQTSLSGFDQSSMHCLVGRDADLIMLALASSHANNICILRETPTTDSRCAGVSYKLIKIWLLKRYLMCDMRIKDAGFEVDYDHVIHDFVFLCLFLGNDFLPGIPWIDIKRGGIDLLMLLYKKEMSRMGGYIISDGKIDFMRLQQFVEAMAKRLEGSSCANYKEHYYAQEFKAYTLEEVKRVQQDAASSYLVGLQWIVGYYFRGFAGGTWFYPYRSAPFPSDLMSQVPQMDSLSSSAAAATERPIEDVYTKYTPSKRACLEPARTPATTTYSGMGRKVTPCSSGLNFRPQWQTLNHLPVC